MGDQSMQCLSNGKRRQFLRHSYPRIIFALQGISLWIGLSMTECISSQTAVITPQSSIQGSFNQSTNISSQNTNRVGSTLAPTGTPSVMPTTQLPSTVYQATPTPTVAPALPSSAVSSIPANIPNNNSVPSNTQNQTTSQNTPDDKNLGGIYSVEIKDGPTFLEKVIIVTKNFTHAESLAAFAATALLPANPDADFASVCMQRTNKGIFRIHSQNPAAIGIVNSTVDLTAYNSLFTLSRGDTFNYNIPLNINGTGQTVTYYGQIFLKHGDGSALGDVICFARYR